MRKKDITIWLVLIISIVLAITLLDPAIAADNTSLIRISCTIPALPGKNMPILQEQRITNIKEPAATPVMFQKDTKEARVIRGEKLLLDLETFYNR